MISPRVPVYAARVDALLSPLVGATIFSVYLATIYPGLLDIGDASKFAFVGKVLGTPHAPGYPLYVMVSHVFAYLPIGTLAYRMNLLSAILGAIAAALGYMIARRLGVRPAVAVSAALALGLGHAFWSTALYAKTYTLNAALVSAGVLMLLRWSDGRRVSDLYGTVAIFALAIGNHLSVIALVPALVLFALLTEARTVLRPQTIVTTALLVFLGLMQYGFIIVRTLQRAPYLEASASNLPELWAVITARRFSHEIGAYSLSTLMSSRVPQLARLIGGEFGMMGVLLVGVGLAALLARRRCHALLFGAGALGVASLTANMSSGEDQGFLLSVFVMLWPVAAVGMEWIFRALLVNSRRTGAALALSVAALLPSIQVLANYQANDHHTETGEGDYFDALFEALPEKTAIVHDEYRVNMALRYKLLGEQAAGARDIRLIGIDRDGINHLRSAGFEVLAFREGRRALSEYGFSFSPFEVSATGKGAAAVHRRDVYRVASSPVCLDIGNVGWVDMGGALRTRGRMAVKIDNFRPYNATLTIYAGASLALHPALMATNGVGTPILHAEVFARGDANTARRLADLTASDGVVIPEDVWQAPFLVRAQVRVNDRGKSSAFSLDMGGSVVAAIGSATVDLDNPKRATVCSHAIEEADVNPNALKATILPDATDVQFDRGWYPAERRPDGLVSRWTSDRAAFLLPLSRVRAVVIAVEAASLDYPKRAPGGVTLIANGRALAHLQLAPYRKLLVWTAPEDVIREGLNEFVLDVDDARRPSSVGLSSDTRLLGLSVTRIEVSDLGAAAP